MKKSNSTKKAQSAFWKLGAVALITATLAMCFTACKQTGGGNSGTGGEGGKPTPKPKHAITFNVDGANGKIKAKADGVDETSTSPINVEEGKTVTFTAKANYGYRVKGWMLDGNAVNGTNNSYSFTVTKPATVKVSFEPTIEYTVTLIQQEHGKVTALPEIPADKQVAEGTEITFTATADTGYKIGKWTVTGSALEAGTGADGSSTAKVKITADTTVSVSFEPLPKRTITFCVEHTSLNGWIYATFNDKKLYTNVTDKIEVLQDTTIIFTAKANAGYKVKDWMVDNVIISNNSNTYTHTVKGDATVKVSFELLPPGKVVFTLSPDKLNIKLFATTSDGSPVEVEGCSETSFASYTNGDPSAILHANSTTVTLKGRIIELWCYDNQLIALDIQDLTGLKRLTCEKNKLTELNVQGLTALESLHCSDNKLTELNVQGLTALQTLNCNDNQLTSLNVQGCTSLQWLNCSYNKFTALDVRGLPNLRSFSCYGNQIKAEAMTKILNALLERSKNDNAECILYTVKSGEENHTDFTSNAAPESLKIAFQEAKKRNWALYKLNGWGNRDRL